MTGVIREGYLFCAITKTVYSVFFCASVMQLLSLVDCICVRFLFSAGMFVIGPRSSSRERDKCVFLLFCLAKLVMWLTRRNQVRRKGATDPELLFKGMVSAWGNVVLLV